MLIKCATIVLLFLTFTYFAFAQQPAASPAPNEQAVAQLQEQIDLLKKQQELEKVQHDLANQRMQGIIELLPRSSLKPLDPTLSVKNDKQASSETISLSYDALNELSRQIADTIKPNVARYSGLVIYNEPDFLGLAKYRLYRHESQIALDNYGLMSKAIETVGRRSPEIAGDQRFRVKSIDPVTMALNLPAIGTAYARSVGELLSVFRSETTITQTTDTIEPSSIGTAMANELKKGDPSLRIFYPQAFVPEYDLETEGEDSLFVRMSKVNAASANIADFLTQTAKLPEDQKNSSPLRETIAFAGTVQKQLRAVTIDDPASQAIASSRMSTESAAPRETMSDFRMLIRAEKLDRFLHTSIGANSGPPESWIGVLKLRLLASGGSRKETRNLFLGNRLTYSGGAVVEVLLFDADGTLRSSEIFSLHTGFRKMKTNHK
jgi:hypothetical protein